MSSTHATAPQEYPSLAKPRAQQPLPYRVGVGIMLVNRDGLIWLGERRPKWLEPGATIWQMPQGGLLGGESPRAAALRELREETGVRHVDVLGAAGEWLSYDLPPDLMGIALKGRYRGQRQKWFAMRFTGREAEISIEPRRRKAEFEDWRWAHADEAIDLAVPHKRDFYARVLAALSVHVAPAVSARRRRPVSWWQRLRTAIPAPG